MDFAKHLVLVVVSIGAAENAVLTFLAKPRDAELLAGEFVTEIYRAFTALHAPVASDGKHTATTEQPHG